MTIIWINFNIWIYSVWFNGVLSIRSEALFFDTAYGINQSSESLMHFDLIPQIFKQTVVRTTVCLKIWGIKSKCIKALFSSF